VKGVSRAQATRGVEERLDATLHAYPGLHLVPEPPAVLRAPPGPGPRILRGGRLPDLGDTAAAAHDAVRDFWHEAGCRIEETPGRVLVVHDPAGYVITLTRTGDADPLLTVASPRVPAEVIDRGLLAGLLAGVAFGCAGPCFFSVVPMTAFPSLAGLSAPFWGWIPLYLLVGGGSVWMPETRKFGAGLLISGAIVGASVAGIFS
jgi:hypothetical protein